MRTSKQDAAAVLCHCPQLTHLLTSSQSGAKEWDKGLFAEDERYYENCWQHSKSFSFYVWPGLKLVISISFLFFYLSSLLRYRLWFSHTIDEHASSIKYHHQVGSHLTIFVSLVLFIAPFCCDSSRLGDLSSPWHSFCFWLGKTLCFYWITGKFFFLYLFSGIRKF